MNEDVDAAIGGGVESITDDGARRLARIRGSSSTSPALYMAMGDTAEVVAKRYGITPSGAGRVRARQPAAHRRARSRTGSSTSEIAPIDVASRGPGQEDRRQGRREKTCASIATSAIAPTRRWKASEAAAGVRHHERQRAASPPATRRSCPTARSATLVMSALARAAAGHRVRCCVFRGYAVAGCEPDEMGIGPVFAVPKLLETSGTEALTTSTSGS